MEFHYVNMSVDKLDLSFVCSWSFAVVMSVVSLQDMAFSLVIESLECYHVWCTVCGVMSSDAGCHDEHANTWRQHG